MPCADTTSAYTVSASVALRRHRCRYFGDNVPHRVRLNGFGVSGRLRAPTCATLSASGDPSTVLANALGRRIFCRRTARRLRGTS
ncbi:unnamed protein product, partial [Iphiclides podalirius]